ncbi:MAG: helix-turn-helix domain-containing protein [Terracidiphilus sp.]
MDQQIELLRKILDMLTLVAEPQIAQRDAKARAALSELIGKGLLKAKAVALMNGTKTQSQICRETGIDQGALSRLMKSLKEKSLIGLDEKHPKLTIPLPPGFAANAFETEAAQ